MKRIWLVCGLMSLLIFSPLEGEGKKAPAPVFQVPYRLSNSLHVVVRTKINGKGPFNFIVDTGAPLLYISVPAGKKIGLTPDDKHWAILDKFEIEGGLVRTKVKCRVETPFQLEGMNGLGMAGMELHGIMGYTFLAQYRLELDFTSNLMAWTKLDYDPPAPQGPGGKGGKGGGGAGGLEVMGALMKVFGALMGRRAEEVIEPRGFLGLEVTEDRTGVKIQSVVRGGPAVRAGLRTGDRIEQVRDRPIRTAADVYRLTANLAVGQAVRFLIRRGDEKKTITVTPGEGL